MITIKEYLKYLLDNGTAGFGDESYVELCWHCRKAIRRDQRFCAVRDEFPGSTSKKEIFFHKFCFTEIAGDTYTFYE